VPSTATQEPVATAARSETGAVPLLTDAAGLGDLAGWSARTTWRKLAGGLIPAPVRVGGAVRWRISEIQGWIDAGCPSRTDWDRIRTS